MARARKLFPVYGSSLANNMIAAIERGRVVADFVALYVRQYERRGILGDPTRDKELDETIGREVILAMIVEVRRALPRFYGKTQYDKLKDDQKETIEVFLRECIAALGRVWNLQGEDKNHFERDLALYSEFGSRTAAPPKHSKAEKVPQTVRQKSRNKAQEKTQKKLQQTVQHEEPPFVGRVALLLDPSMIDQARKAARKFHVDAERLGQTLLRQTLRPGK